MLSELNLREKKVLKALISEYILTAKPVSSRVIAEKYRLGISSATIRNLMQDLEEKGLLTQPHPSAGRIPTDKAYRIYVDNLISPEKLTTPEKEKIKKDLFSDYTAIDDLLAQTSRILGRTSSLLGVTIAPHLESEILTRIDLLSLAEKRLLVVLAARSGIVKSIILEIDSEIKPEALQETEKILNQRLCGLSLKDIMFSAEKRLKDSYTAKPSLIKLFLDSTDNLLTFQEEEKIYLSEPNKLLDQPEFKDWNRLSSFSRIIEDKRFWLRTISDKVESKGVSIAIGRELGKQEIEACSLICCAYGKGNLKGKVGLIGPTRMRYAKLVSLVDYTSVLLGEVLSQ
ncbi:MAG TPA: heat-inducible transcriptional repressor HrcA [Terriglobales bacterium]|nr:heat-inducible transcriptional repressor HrcA [Terriglobales bacterium]